MGKSQKEPMKYRLEFNLVKILLNPKMTHVKSNRRQDLNRHMCYRKKGLKITKSRKLYKMLNSFTLEKSFKKVDSKLKKPHIKNIVPQQIFFTLTYLTFKKLQQKPPFPLFVRGCFSEVNAKENILHRKLSAHFMKLR